MKPARRMAHSHGGIEIADFNIQQETTFVVISLGRKIEILLCVGIDYDIL